jgi:DNA-binding winged helix-turn-helix (wHTH) protein/tetratricopeptide (TPR) repeat protein
MSDQWKGRHRMNRVIGIDTEALIRTADLAARAEFQLGEATINPATRMVRGPGGEADLEPRVMQVLLVLADAAGSVVTRDTLFHRCWGSVFVGDDSLNRAVGGVRKVAENVAGGSFVVETVPRTGYQLVVKRGAQGGSAGEEDGTGRRPHLVTTSAAGAGGVSRRVMMGGGLAAVGGAAGLWWIARDRTDPRVAGLLDDGKRILREGWPDSEAQGVDLFRRAAKLDPGNDEAWGWLALALRNVIEHAPPNRTSAVLECESAARRALAINPKEGNALTALAMMRPEFGNWFEAEASLSHVLRVAPDNLAAMAHLALLFQSVGRTRDSGVLNDRLVALDPLSPVYQFRRAMRLWVLGRIAEADQTIDRALQLWPRHPAVWSARITIFSFTGRTGAAEQLLDDIRMRPSTYMAASGERARVSLRALGSGAPADVAAAVKANVKAAPQSGGSPPGAVMILSALGELDAAFDVAEGFLLRRGPLVGSLRNAKEDMPGADSNWRRTMNLFTPATAAMRADPRFKRLCDGMGMTAYWRKRGIWPDPMFRLSFQPA